MPTTAPSRPAALRLVLNLLMLLATIAPLAILALSGWLAFIRPEKPEDLKLTPIITAEAAPMNLLDDVIVLGRLGKDLNREPVVMTNEVISLVTKPRLFAKIGAQAIGMPVFNKDGKFLGIGINRFSAKGESESQNLVPSNVVLPAADVLESAAQAM